MAPWAPGDPWPSGTPGGASRPAWGPYVRLWLRAGLAPGRTFVLGPSDTDRLDAGNVLGGAPTVAARAASTSRATGAARAGRVGTTGMLWVDLECDATEVNIGGGASGSAGIFSKADAATLTVKLRDPDQIYDPLNGDSPYAYGGRSRLVPGTPVECYAEVVDPADGSWQRFWLFTGTADSWGEDWTPRRAERFATMVATDVTKQFVAMDRPEQPAQGAGDTTVQRIHRIVDFFGWAGEVVDPPGASAVTLQATTLAQSAWELLNRTTDDEIGYVYFDPEGRLRWINRATWGVVTDPVVTFGCPDITPGAPDGFDVLTDASPSNLDRQIRNAVYASPAGGTLQTEISQSSIDRFGQYDFKRTDLGVASDTLAAQWAEYVVVLYAFPQVALSDVTALPGISDRSWETWAGVLGVVFVVDLVRILWAPPDHPDHVIDSVSRVVGFEHRITPSAWEVTWQLIAANSLSFGGSVFTMGPHAQDHLDSGYVLGFTSTGAP